MLALILLEQTLLKPLSAAREIVTISITVLVDLFDIRETQEMMFQDVLGLLIVIIIIVCSLKMQMVELVFMQLK